ncbi:uncharacterized protein LOC144118376 [Amblyomma americanum]
MCAAPSGLWDTMAVVIEEVYHFAMASLCGYDLVLDTYYGVKPKRPIGNVVVGMVLLAFHCAFLSRGEAHSMLPVKLVHLLDMLFHVTHCAWEAMNVVAVLRCPHGTLDPETALTQDGTSCYADSVMVALITIVYHVGALATYYRWVEMRPTASSSQCLSACTSWLRQRLHSRLSRPVTPLSPQLLGDTLDLERPLEGQQICLASFEISHRPVPSGIKKRRPAAQVSGIAAQLQDDVDD